MVQHLLDRGIDIKIEGIGSAVTAVGSTRDVVELSLNQEKGVTPQFTDLTRAARDTNDFLGERFMQWFGTRAGRRSRLHDHAVVGGRQGRSQHVRGLRGARTHGAGSR